MYRSFTMAAVPLVFARVIPVFAERHPQVVLDVSVNNQPVNIVSEGFDAGRKDLAVGNTEVIAFTGVVLLFEPGNDFVRNDTPPKQNHLLASLLASGNWTRIFSISFTA